jgi:hypothetical protein
MVQYRLIQCSHPDWEIAIQCKKRREAEDATEGIHVAALLWEQQFVAASRVANGHSGPCPLDDHNRSR